MIRELLWMAKVTVAWAIVRPLGTSRTRLESREERIRAHRQMKRRQAQIRARYEQEETRAR